MSTATINPSSTVEGFPTEPQATGALQYLLPHTKEEILRLRRQHEFTKSSVSGELVAAPIAKDTAADLKILDCGCADGTWLREMPAYFSNAKTTLYGIDIAENLFVQEPPQDIEFHGHSILSPVPAEWGFESSFDLIQQKLLVWAFKTEQWPLVVSRLASLVKTGGYLQLVEAEWIYDGVNKGIDELKKLSLLQAWSAGNYGMDIHVGKKLDSLLKQAGLVDVHVKTINHGFGGTAREAIWVDTSAKVFVDSFRQFADNFPADGIAGVAQTKVEYLAYLDRLFNVVQSEGYTVRLNMAYGRKP